MIHCRPPFKETFLFTVFSKQIEKVLDTDSAWTTVLSYSIYTSIFDVFIKLKGVYSHIPPEIKDRNAKCFYFVIILGRKNGRVNLGKQET